MQKKLAAEIWGSPEAVDSVGDYTPMNIHKARWSLVRKELHDSLGLCNWMGPWVASPLKERGYSGDDISFITTSTGAIYLFSSRHLERPYAAFLAERADPGCC